MSKFRLRPSAHARISFSFKIATDCSCPIARSRPLRKPTTAVTTLMASAVRTTLDIRNRSSRLRMVWARGSDWSLMRMMVAEGDYGFTGLNSMV